MCDRTYERDYGAGIKINVVDLSKWEAKLEPQFSADKLMSPKMKEEVRRAMSDALEVSFRRLDDLGIIKLKPPH